MVETTLKVLLVVFGVGLAAWLVAIERAFSSGFAKFKERDYKPGQEPTRAPMNPDKIVV